MEVKVGVQHAPRELAIESPLSADEVEKLVSEALSGSDGVLTLVDDRGRKVVIPVAKIAFIEIGEPQTRPVGFGAI